MPSGTLRRLVLTLVLAVMAAGVAGCGGSGGGIFKQEFEYEEEIVLSLDGSATVTVNASVPALVALRGFNLDVNPRARVDRQQVRALFSAPGVDVNSVSLSRRHRRRFVHVSLDVADVRRLPAVAPFAWSTYRLDHRGGIVAFQQVVGRAAGRTVSGVDWKGDEQVRFRVHVPSRIANNNSPEPVQRGNILEWDQSLADRLRSVPLDLQIDMEPKSILYSTLLLFGGTIIAAAITFTAVLWWVARRGRDADTVETTNA